MERQRSFYEKHVKRVLDILCALLAMIAFCWLYLLIAVLVHVKLGSPVLFKQPRPGLIDPRTGQERIFDLYKFRTMTNEKDENGRLLSDELRLGRFGKLLRSTSLDELPEAFNILKGDMSVIGPRPQLVRDMVFMSEQQRMRHTAKPGLSGLAQVMGRNAISWDEKLEWDLKYIDSISFWEDIKVVILTVKKVFLPSGERRDSTETDITLDFGDALLAEGRISRKKYEELQTKARELLESR